MFGSDFQIGIGAVIGAGFYAFFLLIALIN
jgi:hypothetical protein